MRIDWHRAATITLGITAGVVASVGTLAVAVAGFTLSFDAIRAVAVAANIRHSWAWLMPLSVDGAMAVATVAAVVLRRMGRHPAYPWLVVLTGAGISIACNALHARGRADLGTATAMAVSAIPPVMLALSVHLLVVLAVAVADGSTTATPPRQPDRHTATASDRQPAATPPPPPPPPATAAPPPPATATPPRQPSGQTASDRQPAATPPRQSSGQTASDRQPAATPPRQPSGQTASAIAALHRQYPTATASDLAALAGLSIRTVQRYLPRARAAART